jgi:hypothetical protein
VDDYDVKHLDLTRDRMVEDPDVAHCIDEWTSGRMSDQFFLERMIALREFAKQHATEKLDEERRNSREEREADEGDLRHDQEMEDRMLEYGRG